MLRLLVAVLLVLGAHLNLTPFAPADAGKAVFFWPFAKDSRPWLASQPSELGNILTPGLAGIAGLAFLAALASLFGFVVPAGWWQTLTIIAAAASALLYALYAGPLALIPLLIDAILLWGALTQGWTAERLAGG